MSCVNENCQKDPMMSSTKVLATMDGDFACSPECLAEYERQRDHFMNVVVHDDDKFRDWMGCPWLTKTN